MTKWTDHVKAYAKKHGCSYKEAMQKSKHTYGGMLRLPEQILHEVSGYVRPPRVHEVQQQFQGYTHRILPLEHGVREQETRRARNIHNLGVMNANRRERLREYNDYLQQDPDEILADIQHENPDQRIPLEELRQMYRVTGRPIPYLLINAYPMLGTGMKKKKGGVLPPNDDLILIQFSKWLIQNHKYSGISKHDLREYIRVAIQNPALTQQRNHLERLYEEYLVLK